MEVVIIYKNALAMVSRTGAKKIEYISGERPKYRVTRSNDATEDYYVDEVLIMVRAV